MKALSSTRLSVPHVYFSIGGEDGELRAMSLLDAASDLRHLRPTSAINKGKCLKPPLHRRPDVQLR